MAVTAEDVLALVRELPRRERLKLLERVVHEVVEAESKPALLTEKAPIFDDLTDDEFADFLETIQRNRREQPLRSPR